MGLGNPGPAYRETRHNVGQRVVEQLAEMLAGSPALRRWHRDDGALLAVGTWHGEPVKLLKPGAFMNVSGPVVVRALRRHHLGPADLILVYDDIDLALGKVRIRMKGSHGGHNGVRSVIESLGTSDIRRVKIGVGRPESKHDVADHVLTGFEDDELPVVEAAVAEAATRVLALVERPAGAG